jgi:hypothetical protein
VASTSVIALLRRTNDAEPCQASGLTQRTKIVQTNLKVVTFVGLARQTDLWNSSVRCPRRMHLTSRLYREESHGAADPQDRDAARASPLTEPGNRPRPPRWGVRRHLAVDEAGGVVVVEVRSDDAVDFERKTVCCPQKPRIPPLLSRSSGEAFRPPGRVRSALHRRGHTSGGGG